MKQNNIDLPDFQMPIRNSTVPQLERLAGASGGCKDILKLLRLCDCGWEQPEGTVCAPAAICLYLPV